jgi:hypothetical protein
LHRNASFFHPLTFLMVRASRTVCASVQRTHNSERVRRRRSPLQSGTPSPLHSPAAGRCAPYSKRSSRQPALNGHRTSRGQPRELLFHVGMRRLHKRRLQFRKNFTSRQLACLSNAPAQWGHSMPSPVATTRPMSPLVCRPRVGRTASPPGCAVRLSWDRTI